MPDYFRDERGYEHSAGYEETPADATAPDEGDRCAWCGGHGDNRAARLLVPDLAPAPCEHCGGTCYACPVCGGPVTAVRVQGETFHFCKADHDAPRCFVASEVQTALDDACAVCGEQLTGGEYGEPRQCPNGPHPTRTVPYYDGQGHCYATARRLARGQS